MKNFSMRCWRQSRIFVSAVPLRRGGGIKERSLRKNNFSFNLKTKTKQKVLTAIKLEEEGRPGLNGTAIKIRTFMRLPYNKTFNLLSATALVLSVGNLKNGIQSSGCLFTVFLILFVCQTFTLASVARFGDGIGQVSIFFYLFFLPWKTPFTKFCVSAQSYQIFKVN